MVLSLSMLEGKMSDLDARNESELSGRLNGVKLGQDFPGVGRQRRQNLKTAKGQESDVGLRVGAKFWLGHKSDGILELNNWGKKVNNNLNTTQRCTKKCIRSFS